MKRIKVAIIVDPMGGGGRSAEDEIEDHKKQFSTWLKPDVAEFYQAYYPAEGERGIHAGTELVVYDFGGLGPGSDLMSRNAEELIKWAEDHPSALVVVVSTFTFTNLIEPEMQTQGLRLPNIVVDNSWAEDACPIPEWWLGHPPGREELPKRKLKRPGPPRFK